MPKVFYANKRCILIKGINSFIKKLRISKMPTFFEMKNVIQSTLK